MKCAAAAMLSAVVSLLLRRRNPEAALLLGAVTSLGALTAALGLLDGLRQLRTQVSSMLGAGSETLIGPVFKCLAICLVTRFAVELCRDASQNSVAAAVELTGSACCVSTVLPLLLSVLKMMEGLP